MVLEACLLSLSKPVSWCYYLEKSAYSGYPSTLQMLRAYAARIVNNDTKTKIHVLEEGTASISRSIPRLLDINDGGKALHRNVEH
jgi:hypothetical protein